MTITARYGLESHVICLDGNKHRLQSLIRIELIPRAVSGLKSLGVTQSDSEDFLGIILQRINNKQNGCYWQRQFIQQQNDFKSMTQNYLKNQQTDKPVSEWSAN